MIFTYIEYLALLPLFFLVWAWARRGLWKRRPRQWLEQPALRQVKRSNIISRLAFAVPLLCWLAISCLLIFALANPKTRSHSTFVVLEKKVFVFSYDASTSMGRGPESAMEKIRVIALDFVRRRKGDVIGITAYSGKGVGVGRRVPGSARILMYPTEDVAQVEAAINSVEATMFGAYTAIGDGIFVSILALIDQEARVVMGDRYDRKLLEDNLWSIGEDYEDLSYAKEMVQRIGPQTGKYVILFTDGKYNNGLQPYKAMWFAKLLGMKVHFVAFNSTGATGLNPEDQRKHKEEIVQATLETGGMYLESSTVEGIAPLLREVENAEKSRVMLAGEPREENQQYTLFVWAALLFMLWVLFENIWMKVPG
ncbi:MAG: hypothetical protein A2945_04390 [Candidatus Liptonbacteria bacterium RIFCSPLOWO2_01_FULL_52_25]|uniref:VWFA domain-containing protein n=1 Tax=Candidatus Liptonbacteria bacterium RIFCSPLOWO2_01_FULL_52_25 TaxID=1798650 RepID=A0A1G2CFR6_9BACT|nr:MAG: hypothetical protein A2945_04390 [Candidatus Liptonbacteria bacterium RIFCSPLOWO2_01_FULL_52_25]